jgi:nitronate monooxygenase
MTNVLDRLELDAPIIQAPMGGFTTPELVAAVCEAGALGSLGSPYLQPDGIIEAAAAVRALTSRPFGLNLFLFERPTVDADAVARTIDLLTPWCRELGIEPPAPAGPFHPDIDDQIEAVLAARPAVFSFTLGLPKPAVVAECRRLGILTVGTATTLAEGLALETLGIDAVCAQGSEAGGHRGTFIGDWREGMIGIVALTMLLKARLSAPVIAAGGIMTGRAARALMDVGADAVQLGTAFLTCPEAATPAPHKQALLTPMATRTRITSAFSGAPARGLTNRFMEQMDGADVAPFPITNSLSRGMRGAAAKAGRTEMMSLWAGQGAPLIRTMPAGKLVETLKAEIAA